MSSLTQPAKSFFGHYHYNNILLYSQSFIIAWLKRKHKLGQRRWWRHQAPAAIDQNCVSECGQVAHFWTTVNSPFQQVQFYNNTHHLISHVDMATYPEYLHPFTHTFR